MIFSPNICLQKFFLIKRRKYFGCDPEARVANWVSLLPVEANKSANDGCSITNKRNLTPGLWTGVVYAYRLKDLCSLRQSSIWFSLTQWLLAYWFSTREWEDLWLLMGIYACCPQELFKQWVWLYSLQCINSLVLASTNTVTLGTE